MAKKFRKTQKPKRRNQVSRKEPIWMGPPTYRQQSIRKWMIRCDVAANAASVVYTTAGMGAMLGVFATSAIASVYLCNSFRITKLQLWSWNSTIGTTVDINMKWSDTAFVGGEGGPPQSVGDSSASLDKPAYCSLVPPKTSIYNVWMNAAAANSLISIYSPQSAILDIHYEFWIDDLGANVAGPVLAGATLGNFYHKAVGSLTVVQPLNGI